MKRVVVYGTLKRGGKLSNYLSTSRFVKTIKLSGFKMYNLGWYPAAVRCDNSQIIGEVYEITKNTEKILDGVEGFPNLYLKTNTSEGFLYYMKNDRVSKNHLEVKNGNWDINI